ncbi:hypothetical protein NPIL_437041 [Nephila pilipes]|uniref:Uncharacterized protein n=1 Tax=Nephila pilipes TaxID=299642 RepID=A0A8X6R6T6_NEPPI|nr:hypothetical protein NPIL_437041 [Nephila pilipes]
MLALLRNLAKNAVATGELVERRILRSCLRHGPEEKRYGHAASACGTVELAAIAYGVLYQGGTFRICYCACKGSALADWTAIRLQNRCAAVSIYYRDLTFALGLACYSHIQRRNSSDWILRKVLP